jgi:hypothetical protein
MHANSASVLCLSILLSACAVQDPYPAQERYSTQELNPAPDLSGYQSVELAANGNTNRITLPARYIAEASYIEVAGTEASGPQRLYIHVEQCRNSDDAFCPRSYALSGNLQAFQTRLKCYIEIRNDSGGAYAGQALQGLCQDIHSRSYSITIAR